MIRIVSILVAALCLTCAGVADEPERERPRCNADVDSCLNWFAKTYAKRGWTGMELNDETYEIIRLAPGTPAAESGIQIGDRLVAVHGIEIHDESNMEQLLQLQREALVGSTRTYTLKRDGRRRNYDFTLVPLPLEVVARQVGMHMLTDHAVPAANADD